MGADPLTTVADAAAVATGQEELLPLVNAGVSTGENLAKGKGLGTSLGKGLVSGGEALAGQELAGAVGIGSGNTAVNNALGVDISPGATGLPDIGGGISDAIGGVKDYLGGTSTPTSAGSLATGTGATGNDVSSQFAKGLSVPSSGSGFASASNVADLSKSALDTQLGSTSSATQLGSSGADSLGIEGGFSDGKAIASSSAPTSTLGKLVSGGSDIAKVASLGNVAYNALSGPGKLPSASQPLNAGGAVTAPLIQSETTNLAAANAGTVTPAAQASIDQYTQQARNQLIQQLANEGVTNFAGDSRYIQGINDINKQAQALQTSFIHSEVDNAYKAAGLAGSNLGQVANEQVSQDSAFQQSLNAAFQALGGLYGGQDNRKTA
jgi:hypothetical protein